MENITPGTGENNLYAAVRKSKVDLAQAGKVSASMMLTVACRLVKAQWWITRLTCHKNARHIVG